MQRDEHYRAEAERVQRLANAAAPGEGREHFEKAAAEYRRLADYYGSASEPGPEARAH